MEKTDILVRYGEISLKGDNRSDFEKILAHNLKHALSGFAHGPIERPRGRIMIRDVDRAQNALDRVVLLPGVTSASVAMRTGHSLEEIVSLGTAMIGEALDRIPGQEPVTFKVESTRTYKAFPLTSMELSARLGGELIHSFPRLKARMKKPELLLVAEVRSHHVLLSLAHKKGIGGLPVGSTGKVMVLLSGGIDSPVAAYMAMKRGARAFFINYHSYPFIPELSLDKVKDLARALSLFQGSSLLFAAPFSEIQMEIKAKCSEPLRTVLYRRMMMRLADRAAVETGALAIVTGECLGQVASQTLENIANIGNATSLPVLRPLIGFDKNETVAIAERIGTYPISIRPHPDSCTVFKPRRPIIRSNREELEMAESRLDVDSLINASFNQIQRIRVP